MLWRSTAICLLLQGCQRSRGGVFPRSSRVGLLQTRMQSSVEITAKKVLPLISGGTLIIAERGWILEMPDGLDELYGDQAIPIELDDQLAWLLYRDGEVVITVTDDDIDAADPMEGGSEKLTDPLSIARNTPAGGILSLFGQAMSVLRPRTDSGLLTRWASENLEGPDDTRMSRAIADVQQQVDTLSDDGEDEDGSTAGSAVPDDDEEWVAARREGVLLINEARAKMVAGMLMEAVEVASTARAIFAAEAARGVAAATEQEQRAEKLSLEATRAQEGQAKAREAAVRLAGDAREWLQAGDLAQALQLAEAAQAALEEVEACYGRVTATELTTVLEIRVRAEEKAEMRREAEAAARDNPEQEAATRKREEAEKRQQTKLAEKKKKAAAAAEEEEESKQDAAAPARKEEEEEEESSAPPLEEWRAAKSLGASLNRGARLALKAGQYDEAMGLAEEAEIAFREAATKGYRKGEAEARSCRSLAERARMAKGSLDATRVGGVKERKTEGKEKTAERKEREGGDASEANEELQALFAVEAYGASVSSGAAEQESGAEERREAEAEDRRRKAEEEEKERAEAEARRREAEEEERRRREEEEEERVKVLKAEADLLYKMLAERKLKEENERVRVEAEATLERWKEKEEEIARAEEEARARAEAEAKAKAKEAEEAKAREEAEAQRRGEEERVRAEAEGRRREEEERKREEAAERRKEEARGDAGAREGVFALGSVVEAKFYEDGGYYEAQVLTQAENGMQWVLFIGYGDEQETALADMRPPSSAPTPPPTSPPPAPEPAPASSPVAAAAAPPPPVAPRLRAPPRPAPELQEGARQGSIGQAVQGTQMVSVSAGGEAIGEKRYEMPVKYHGVLLGKQGLTVKAMQKASGAQIRFEKEPVGAIVIKGTEKQRAEAWKLIKGMQATLPRLLTKLREEPIEEGELMSRPTLRGRIEDKQAVWPVAVSEAILRVREESSEAD